MDGHMQCYVLCEKTWDLEQVEKFTKLAKKGYGYRMYLDDMPSATLYDHQDHYDEGIPLGYEAAEDERRGDLHEVNIFNHLDITVTVHETELTQRLRSHDMAETA